MIETPLVQGRVEWPIPLRRARKRRDSRVTTYHTSRPSPRTLTPIASPIHEYSHQNDQNPYQQTAEQALDLQFLDYYDLQASPLDNSNLSPVIHQDGRNQSNWQAPVLDQYTLAPNSQNYSQVPERNGPSVQQGNPQSHNSSFDMSWNDTSFMNTSMGQDVDNLSLPDIAGSFGSFDSMMLATPETGTSSISSEYGFPGMDSTFGLPETSLDGLKLPDGFALATGQVLDSASPGTQDSPFITDDLSFEDESYLIPWTTGEVYSSQSPQWSSTTLTQPRQDTTPRPNTSSRMFLNPWNSQQPQIHQNNVDAGVVTFEPPRGITYDTHRAGEEFLEARQKQIFGPEPVSPAWDPENEGWIVTSYPSSYANSHNSPHSQGSPPSNASSPIHVEPKNHSHVFTSDPRLLPPAKPVRGRTRNLTTQEKKSAREVREAKACWACHISKTKCSPCSPGKPCEQCARLVGKRRFCKFTCFNDPLESLHTFMVPDYHLGHFTQDKVEAFVAKNACGWGTQPMFIRLSWGYHRLLEANVVALTLTPTSELGFSHEAIANGSNRPTLTRKQSPPLGIPLAAMEEMEDSYSIYIRNIVQNDLREFVRIAYDDQVCGFPEKLLRAVCTYYLRGLESDEESVLLRYAIEMLVTSTIFERSLNLDRESQSLVEHHMREVYPPEPVPRCVQRQIKLAFYTLQRKKIVAVLKEWGNMMWTIHNASQNDQRWAIGFCIFIILILVIDKTLGAAYYFCEVRIHKHGYDAESEMKEFKKLVRLTQTELFERCKEIFHWKFKTRKAGKEACNPVRDGLGAFKGRAINDGIAGLVGDLRSLVREYDREIRAHTTFKLKPGQTLSEASYSDAGRLACIFLDDFLERP